MSYTQTRPSQRKKDKRLHDALKKALVGGDVEVFVNEVLLNVPGSPVHSYRENIFPLVIILSGCLSTFILFGLMVGLIMMIFWFILFIMSGKLFVLKRVNERACALLMRSSEDLQYLWENNALFFRDSEGREYHPQEADWRDLAREIKDGKVKGAAPGPGPAVDETLKGA